MPTPKELPILRALARGFTNRETARELGIGLRTVEKCRHNVAKRLGIPTRMLMWWVGRNLDVAQEQ